MIEPRWEVKIGSSVTVTDGNYSRLQQLLVDPQEQRVVGLLVRPHGLLPYHPMVVPENLVVDASENEVRLNISREQMEALPEYLPNTELAMDRRTYDVHDNWSSGRREQGVEVGRATNSEAGRMIGNLSIRPGPQSPGLLIRAGQRVFCQDEYAGWVALILLDPSGQVTGFVLHTRPLFGRNLIVPIAWVHEVERNRVSLSVEKRDLDDLSDYGPDDALAAKVKKALWSDEILRNTDYGEIDISVKDGTARLQGHVSTVRNKKRAEEAAYSIIGVLGLENDLVVDDDIVTDVAQALGKDDRIRFERITAGAQNGFITLNGHVDSVDLREAARWQSPYRWEQVLSAGERSEEP